MKIKTIISSAAVLFLSYACTTSNTNSASDEVKEYQPTFESLSQHEAAPEWFQDAKLGMYFHWGPYSVPAYGSAWYPANMYLKGSKVNQFHEKNFGPIEEFGYEDFIPMFKGEHFDAEEWANLFKMTGAKFAGPIAQHHDGFAMWDSDVNPWNCVDMGPKRDITGELFAALRKREIKTIATLHHARNGQRNANTPEYWLKNGFNSHYPYHPDLPTATTDPKLRKLFGNWENIEDFNQYWLDQVVEVVDKYQPDILWYDSWLNMIPEEKINEMVAYHFNSGLKNKQEVVVCSKHQDIPWEYGVDDMEQGGRRDIYPLPWMTDVTLSNKRWMYVEGEPYKEAALVVRNMIDVWSKNGTVLLNISPRADGVINQEQRDILKDIGDWMNVHGEAVYGTRPFHIFGYGTANASDASHDGQSAKIKYTANDVRYTVAKDKKSMYVFFLGVPEGGKRINMRAIGGFHRNQPPSPIKDIKLIGSNVQVKWKLTPQTLQINMPDVEYNPIATVLKLELE
ncbi:alpha-L-fucosidase [Saccharicrinis aurantiacus]|uniref:alpha-L-fucosidase n=1 Tax=Saccharicrinis aurantiacus TaxID=1849719 RepID=UPI000838E1E8|nr:alpha-L-fucosidase [Saccharicrinis aurantiacus]